MSLHAVAVRQLENEAAHDVVDARAQPTARDDPATQRGRVEEDAIPRPGELERRPARVVSRLARLTWHTVVEQHAFDLAHGVERRPAQPRHQRRIVTTGAQRLDLEVGRLDPLGSLRNGEIFGKRRQRALR